MKVSLNGSALAGARGFARIGGVSALASLSVSFFAIEAAAQSQSANLPEIVVQSGEAPSGSPPPPAATETQANDEPAVQGEATAYSPVEGYTAYRSATGTKTDTPLKEVPQSISVVGQEQIRDQGAQTLQETVRYTAGVVADGFGFDTRNDYAIIRGVPADYFIDGLAKGGSRSTYFNTIPIEPYALERIEVLRGPSSMLFGQTAAGGIINGVSKRPSENAYNEVGIDYGSFDFRQAKFDTTGKLSKDGKWLYRVTGLVRESETQVDFVDNDRIMLQPAITYRPSQDTEITLIANYRNDNTGSVQQFLPQAGTLFPNVNGMTVPRSNFLGEPDDIYDTRSRSATLLVDHNFTPNLKLHHGTRYTKNENEYDSHYPAILTPFRFASLNALLGGPIFDSSNAPFFDANQSEIARVRSIQNTKTDVLNSETYLTADVRAGGLEHKITGGVDYMRYDVESKRADLLDNLFTATSLQTFANNFFGGNTALAATVGLGLPGLQSQFNIYNPAYGQTPYYVNLATAAVVDPNNITLVSDPDEVQAQLGFYVQDQVRLGRILGVFGLRHDTVDIKLQGSPDVQESATTGRAGLMYEFDFGLTPYVSYSQSFKPQPGIPVSDQLFAPVNRRAATPREGEQIEVGFKFQPEDRNFVINASIYELKEENLVVTPDTLAENLIGGETEVRGFEIEAAGQLTPAIKVIAGYSYTDAVWTNYPDPLSIKAGTPLDGIPEHLASLWGFYTFQSGALKGLSLGAGVRYVGETTNVAQDLLTNQRLSVTTPSFTLLDATIAYETDSWRWQLTGQNIADEYHLISCTAFRGDCAIGQARTITTSLTMKF